MVQRSRDRFTRLRAEGLELRQMLSGHPLSAAVAAVDHAAAHVSSVQHFIAPALSSSQQAAHSQVFGAFGAAASSETELTATLSDPNNSASTGTVKYETETENGVAETEFKVSITGAAVSTTLNVSLGGTVIGTITTDANGAGTLDLSSNPNANQQALPANFPTSVTAGTAVSVGTLAGSLATPTDHEGCGATTTLSAALTDPNSAATGTVSYQTSTHNGTTNTTFSVSVTGAAASTALDVSIGGTVVGTLNTDATGAGTLVLASNPTGSQQALPANFPTSLTAGTAVTVGTLTGSLAVSTPASTEMALSATLTDPNSTTSTGTVKFETGIEHGTSHTVLVVKVTGAAASTALDVSIGGVSVGTITTDANGAGKLILSSNPHGSAVALPANFPASITAGTTVTVGTLTGTLATSTSTHGHRH